MKFYLSFLIFTFSINSFCQVIIQPIDMDDQEYADQLILKPSFNSFEDHFISKNSVWNDEFEAIIQQWDSDPATIDLNSDFKLIKYLNSNALNSMTLAKVNSYLSKPLWQPQFVPDKIESISIMTPDSMRLFVNGIEVYEKNINIPKGETVQLVMISNKYYPILYWGKIDFFNAPRPEAFSKFKCIQQNSDRDLEKKGVLKPESNCLQKSLIRTIGPKDSESHFIKVATPYVLGGLALIGLIYFSGYELFWLGI